MKTTSKLLTVLAMALFLGALVLPSLQFVVLGKETNWEGWRATAFALGAIGDVDKNPSALLLGAAALGNAAFLLAPLLLWGKPSAQFLRNFALCVMVSLALALWSPHVFSSEQPKLLSGYVIWILAYMALLASIALRLLERRTETGAALMVQT